MNEETKKFYPVESVERVRYCETDRMGYFHHANYPILFEIGRTDWIRQHGINYKQVEDKGIVLPVAELQVKYHSPAFYDDELLLETYLAEVPRARMRFITNVYRKGDKKLLCKGIVTLAIVNKETGRLARDPEFIHGIDFDI